MSLKNRYFTGFLVSLFAGVQMGAIAAEPAPAKPVLRLGFEGTEPEAGKPVGVRILPKGPSAPEFPDFSERNSAAFFGGDGDRVEIQDPGVKSVFDFTNGDEITIEAWVNPEGVHEGQNVYVIGKGRTNAPGGPQENQNWALRLRGQGSARASFLFRAQGGEFHRWTSDAGIAPGSGWHHVAVTYTFGKPDSIRGYIDGTPTAGVWDMGGATQKAPTVDDDAVWVGSSRAGSPGNSFSGGLDQITVYRGIVPGEELEKRYRFEAKKLEFPEGFEAGRTLVEIYEGLPGSVWPSQTTEASDCYQAEGPLAFFRVPPKYNDWGVRTDRKLPYLLRAYAEVELPKGNLELLVRGRGGIRLWYGDRILATTSFLKKSGGGAHGLVKEYVSEDPRLRPLPLGDREAKVKFNSPGGKVRFILDTVVGTNGVRPEVGETLLAFRQNGSENFRVAASDVGKSFELNDAEWSAFRDGLRQEHAALDKKRRIEAKKARASYWEGRHERAREFVGSLPEVQVPEVPGHYPVNNAVDRFLAAKHHAAAVAAAKGAGKAGAGAIGGEIDFKKDIEPLLEQHCFRCHGEKEKGDLRLDTRDSALAGGESGEAAIKPGDPSHSFLLELVKDEGEDRMPPKGDALGDEEVALLEIWIKEGAHYGDESVPPPPDFTAQTGDLDFLRRLFLDVVGVIPSPEEVEAFLADSDPNRRTKWIDRLLDDPRWADAWVPYWQDVLAENPNILKPSLNNSGPFRHWIYEAFYDNRPADQMVTELVTFQGSVTGGGAGGFKMAAENDVPMAAKAHILGTAFLGVEMKCARCHDAPFHESTQADLFGLAAMLDGKPIKIPATSSVPGAFVEGHKPRITVSLKPGQSVKPGWPFAGEEKFGGAPPEAAGQAAQRSQLAQMITRPENRRFAEVMVNRIWKRYMGQGIVEPVSDWEGNAPSHPELLDHLARELVASGYDIKHVARLVLNSSAYQREAVPPAAGTTPESRYFAAPARRRLSAEQLVDSLYAAAGLSFDTEAINFDVEGYHPAKNFLNMGMPKRAWEFNSISNERDRPSLALPKAQAFLDMLTAFGWRVSRQEPVTERDVSPNVLQPGAVSNGVLATWVTRLTGDSGFTADALRATSPEEFVDAVFRRILTRPPTEAEREAFVAQVEEGFGSRIVEPVNSPGETPRGPRVTRVISWSNHLSPEANSIKIDLEKEARAGRSPSARLDPEWRKRAEDAVWALVNAPEMVFIP